MRKRSPPANLILQACVPSRGSMLEFPSIVFVDACELQTRIDPTQRYPPF
jgi:hypothetical protein